MKRHFSLLIVGLAIAFSPLMVNGQVSFSAGIQISSPTDFFQPLAPLGSWVNLSYGRCWHPNGVATDWQPYTDGQWVWTDAGWYWQSNEPWGWATCHYGSWVNDPSHGWCWIPGTEWAPAWVTWRQGDNYIGWAPIGPNRAVLAPQFFVFAGIHDFGRAFRGRGDFVRDNRDFINSTRVINDFSTRNVNIDGRQTRISYNRGPALDSIQRATGKTFQARPIQDVVREHQQPANLRQNRNEQQPTRENQPERTPREGQVPPTGREHGITTPNQERPAPPTSREQGITTPNQEHQAPQRAQPDQRNQLERPGQQPGTTQERPVPPTGREHGISTPPQQREVPTPSQPNRPSTTERPTPTPMTPRERQAPPTGQEHGTSFPQQQREVPTPAQPNRTEREQPSQQRQVTPTGQEHGTSFPQQQQREARPAETAPQKAQPAPEKAPQPEQRKQDDGKNQGNQ